MDLNNFLNNFFLFEFFFLILRNNNIGEKGAEEVSKLISSLTNNCPLTHFSIDLK
jgi:hypothetical protein